VIATEFLQCCPCSCVCTSWIWLCLKVLELYAVAAAARRYLIYSQKTEPEDRAKHGTVLKIPTTQLQRKHSTPAPARTPHQQDRTQQQHIPTTTHSTPHQQQHTGHHPRGQGRVVAAASAGIQQLQHLSCTGHLCCKRTTYGSCKLS
jgi:hypothetical protein